jgi:hypothetical protein
MRKLLSLLLLPIASVAAADVVVSQSLAGIERDGGSVTTVDSGDTLNLGGGATQIGAVAVRLLINNGTVNGGRLVVDSGGFAKGTGTYSVNPLTINGGQYSPGNSPGRGNVEQFIADPGSTYTFEINDGAPGLEGPIGSSNLRGWDLTTVNATNPADSAFFLEATPSQPFTINLVTFTALSPPDVVGEMDNFNPNVSTQWLAFAVHPAASNAFPNGFNAAAFNINSSAFVNTFNGTFGVARDGNNVFITYTAVAVPESAWIGVSSGVLALLAGGWKRTHSRRRGSARYASPRAAD